MLVTAVSGRCPFVMKSTCKLVAPLRDSFRSSVRQQHRSFHWGRSEANQRKSTSSTFRSSSSFYQSISVSGPQGIPSRQEQVNRLLATEDEEEFDLVVIGGGATGCGIALDAAARGLKVTCIERGDFASETSSRSTKLVWAGIRYMATATAAVLNQPLHKFWEEPSVIWNNFIGELKMVRNCHRERRYMLEKQSHLTHWMPIAVPFTSYVWAPIKENQPPPFGNSFFQLFPLLAPFVFKVYDSLSAFSCPPSYLFLSGSQSASLFPTLRYKDTDGNPFIRYVSVFYEAMHNDARTNLAIALTAAQYGAVMCNYVQALDLIKDDDRVCGVKVRDHVTDREWNVRAKRVVVAAGPFTDHLRQMDEATATPVVRGGSGTHIILGPEVLKGKGGVLDFNTSDGRFLFILPWLGHTLVGTTDKSCEAQTRHDPPENEIEWLLKETQTYLDVELKRSDVLSAWRGWRPLAVDPHQEAGAPTSRDHVISENPQTGLLFIAGGKWTTWREMAEEVVDRLTKQDCKTLDIVLHGGGEISPEELVEQHGIDMDIAEHLVSTYGTRAREVVASNMFARLVPNFPYIESEVLYACQEYACTVEDILSRRTRLAFLNKEAARQALPRVAELMAESLGWSRSTQQRQQRSAESYLNSFGGPEAQSPP